MKMGGGMYWILDDTYMNDFTKTGSSWAGYSLQLGIMVVWCFEFHRNDFIWVGAAAVDLVEIAL